MKTQLYLPSQQRALIYLFGMMSTIFLCSGIKLDIYSNKNEWVGPFPKKESVPLDLNAVNEIDLKSLKGIGPVLAGRIIRYREKIGYFQRPGQLEQVYGLTQSVSWKPEEIFCVDSMDFREKQNATPKKYGKKYSVLDINHASAMELENLPGIGPVISKRIVKYREASGGFQKLDELKKIYNFSEENYHKALPFLRIKAQKGKAVRSLPKIDLNKATKNELMKLSGIGEVLAGRIIKFRTLLGFFCRKEQLLSVYGIKQEVFEDIRNSLIISSPLPNPPYEINRASFRQLVLYPAITETLVIKILDERKKLGTFSNWDQMEKLLGEDKNALLELKSYFTL